MRRSSLLTLLILSAPFVAVAMANQATQDAARPATFHHVHLNSADPQAAADFYTRTFDLTKKTSLAGFPAIQSEKIFLLFNSAKPVASAAQSAIWHFGWGSTGMEEDYAKHLANGVVFHTPITKLGSGLLFAYMKAPDGALVEINTSSTRGFIHVHLYSDAPLCAADRPKPLSSTVAERPKCRPAGKRSPSAGTRASRS